MTTVCVMAVASAMRGLPSMSHLAEELAGVQGGQADGLALDLLEDADGARFDDEDCVARIALGE
jgi:hypothetical protein